MLSIEELKRYEWCRFYDCRSNLKEKRSGAKCGKYLAISGYDNQWRIFNIYGGLPILDAFIISLSDAIKIAKYISERYNEFLAVWEVWPDWDLIGIARLSVPEGEAIYNTLNELNVSNRSVTYNDFINLLNKNLLKY
jgi:hypothetical protein